MELQSIHWLYALLVLGCDFYLVSDFFGAVPLIG